MADKNPLAGAENLRTDTAKQLQDIIRLQKEELKNARDLNVSAALLNDIQKKQISSQKMLDVLASSITKKIEKVAELETKIENSRSKTSKAYKKLVADWTSYSSKLQGAISLHNQINKELADAEKKTNTISSTLTKMGFGKLVSISKGLVELWSNPMIAALTVVLYIAKQIFDAFVNMDKAAADFRRSMGIIRKDSQELEQSIRESAFHYAGIGVYAENLYNSVKAIQQSLGSSHISTKGMREDMSIMAVQVGVIESLSAEFLKTLSMVGNSVADAQRDMLFFSQHLSAAAGTNLSDVMSDIASASKSSYQFLSKNPLVLIKSAVEAKRMGTNLDSTTKTASNLLRFTQSVKDEMEASVLLGESLNLQHARELSYRRDLSGLNREILKIAKETNFENLDAFQQESVAKALGKSTHEVSQILQAERERLNILKNPALNKQREAYEKIKGANESIARATAADAKSQLTRVSNQEALKAISLAWIAIMQRMGEAVLPHIAAGLTWIAEKMNIISQSMSGWGKYLTLAIGLTAIWASAKGIGGIIKLLSGISGGIGKGIEGLFGGLARGVSALGNPKVLAGAAAILILSASMIPLAYALKLLEGVKWKQFGVMAASLGLVVGAVLLLGAGPVAAIAGVGTLILLGIAAAMVVFAAAAWVASKAIQNLSNVKWDDIAKGIFSVGIQSPLIASMGLAMLVATPGIVAFSFALVGFSFAANRAGAAMNNLGGGFKLVVDSIERLQNLSLIGTIIQVRDLSKAVIELSKVLQAMPEIEVRKLERIGGVGAGAAAAVAPTQSNDGVIKGLQEIQKELQMLRQDLGSGKLRASTSIDGQKVDATIGRTLEFRGTLA